jgi:hypothetical protein
MNKEIERIVLEKEREMQEYVVHSWGHGKKGWAVTNLYKR